MISQVQEKYPNARMFATTLRQVISANEHLWGAILLADGKWYVEEPREIQVLDRIGGGDGFTGGLLYGVLKNWEPEKCLQFGWASGVLAASSLNDYAEPADEKQVWGHLQRECEGAEMKKADIGSHRPCRHGRKSGHEHGVEGLHGGGFQPHDGKSR